MTRSFTVLHGAAFALAAALLAPLPAAAQQTILPAQSEITFTTKQMGVPVEGRFRKWTAALTFDPKKPEAGKVSFTIDTGSASFGSQETDDEVDNAAWFNVVKFPTASYESTAIKALGNGRYDVAGKLTLKGVTKDVTVPLTLAQSGAQSTATGGFVIKRLDYKVGEGDWTDTSLVANEVNVKFRLAITGIAPL